MAKKLIFPLLILLVFSSEPLAADAKEITDTSAASGAENVKEIPPSKIKIQRFSQIPKRLKRDLIKEKLSFSTGFNVSQSDYFIDKEPIGETTEIRSLSFRVKYGRGDWNLSAKIPYIYIAGPGDISISPAGTVSHVDKKRWGFGHLRLGAQYKLLLVKFRSGQNGSSMPFSFIGKHFDSVGFHIGATVKTPTANDQLGSGELDYSVYSGTFLRSGRWVANARLGYQLMGDTKKTNYNNRWFSSLGGYYVLSKVHSLGLSYYFKQASIQAREPIRNLSTSFNWRLPKGWRLGLYLGTGFSQSSADISSGIIITKTFVRKKRRAPNVE